MRELFTWNSRDIKFWFGLFNSMFRSPCGMIRPFRDHKNHLAYTLLRTNTENLRQIFSEKELRDSSNFHIHVFVSDLYIPTMDLPILLQEICGLWSLDWSWEYINRSQTHECGNWDWGRAIPRKWIHKWGFSLQCSQKKPVRDIQGSMYIMTSEIYDKCKKGLMTERANLLAVFSLDTEKIHCKKGYRFSRPQPGCHLQSLPGREELNYSQLGRVWLLTSRLCVQVCCKDS